jgi:septal ring-binding cell division protein DamX
VVFVEESQGIPISTLEEIRLLSNLETQQHKLLQIVLFGQPELDQNLRQQNIRQLRERITHSFNLLPLDDEDVRAYLTFRLHAAGYHGPDLFSRRVTAYMARACAGLTRRINLVADKALLAAFADGTHNVSLKHVKAAVRDSEFSSVEAPRVHAPVTYVAAGLTLGAVLGVTAFGVYQTFIFPKPETTPPAAQYSPAAQDVVVTTANVPTAAAGPDAVAGGAMAASPPADMLEQRLLATDQWLGEQNAAFYSIQLLGSEDPELLREYFKTIAKYLEIEKVYVYRTIANRRPSLTVLYGTFATRDEVTRTLQGLPDELKYNRPYYRTIQGIRSEIARQRS